ncbi:unnamed protein product, partial [Pylaiella littoralis]
MGGKFDDGDVLCRITYCRRHDESDSSQQGVDPNREGGVLAPVELEPDQCAAGVHCVIGPDPSYYLDHSTSCCDDPCHLACVARCGECADVSSSPGRNLPQEGEQAELR